jgi:hypothetical protein
MFLENFKLQNYFKELQVTKLVVYLSYKDDL